MGGAVFCSGDFPRRNPLAGAVRSIPSGAAIGWAALPRLPSAQGSESDTVAADHTFGHFSGQGGWNVLAERHCKPGDLGSQTGDPPGDLGL